jgi:hypothetical protein
MNDLEVHQMERIPGLDIVDRTPDHPGRGLRQDGAGCKAAVNEAGKEKEKDREGDGREGLAGPVRSGAHDGSFV